nr:cation:proton antiporter [Kiloniellales bacterium]
IVVGLMAMTALSAATGWSAQLTILLGFVVALSSTAVAIKMLEDIGELRTRVGQITVGVLIAQDLAVVPMMLIVGSFGTSEAPAVEAVLKVGLSVGFLALLIFYLSRRKRIQLPFTRLVGKSTDLTPLAGLAFCFGASTISGLLGLSAAYGAFLAGLVIGNSTARKGMLRHSQPIQAILLMVFFLSIGLLIDLRFVWDNLTTFLVIIFFVAVLKTALNIGLLRALGEPWPRAYLSGVLLAQMGEFSFILAALGQSVGAISWENHRFLVSITALSLVIAPFWLTLARRLNRIALLRVTSGKEILRLTLGSELRLVIKSALQAENRLTTLWTAIADWLRRKRKAPQDADMLQVTAETGEALPALAKPERKPD